MATANERNICVELALEGERLCKSGDCRAGVRYFEEAVRLGTDDLKTLSAIYSQLGNAYFYLQNYTKALEYHSHDRTLARSTGDRSSEAKASGNLANAYKMTGDFNSAIQCCNRYLEIARDTNDKINEARALYSLGSIYHTQGKQGLSASKVEHKQHHNEEAVIQMGKASDYYEQNLAIVKVLGDRTALGRVYGSLGNTNYLLGNYRDAIGYHKERLSIAKEFGDRPAERRAYSNLGNAHVLLGEYEKAADFYKRMLNLAKQLKDRAIEAQACYSLGNTYTLLGNYEEAVDYHMRHLEIAKELNDRVGECKAYWSLCNAHMSLGNSEKAMEYTNKQLEIAREVDDPTAETAADNLREMMFALGRGKEMKDGGEKKSSRVRRTSMENMELLRLTPDQAKAMEAAKKDRNQTPSNKSLFRDVRPKDSRMGRGNRPKDIDPRAVPIESQRLSPDVLEDDQFFDLISRLQGRRMNDQRCEIRDDYTLPDFLRQEEPQGAAGGQQEEQQDGEALLRPRFENGSLQSEDRHSLGEDFFNVLMRCQGTRLNDQRSSPPIFDEPVNPTPTLPSEDFIALIIKVQSSRIEDQRCAFRPDARQPTPEIEDPPPRDEEMPQ